MELNTLSGLAIDITKLENGDTNVEVSCPHKTVNSTEESEQDMRNIVQETLQVLRKEGVISSGQPGKKVKRINRTDSLPSFTLYPVKGLDGQMKWVSKPPPPTKKPSVHKKKPPVKKPPSDNNAYSWTPSFPQSLPVPSPATTYGVTPIPDTASYQPIPSNPAEAYQFAPQPINQQASTYVAPTYHAEMLKPGQTLTDAQIAESAFPENNETIQISFGFSIGGKGISIGKDQELNLTPEQQGYNIYQTGQIETGFDFGLLAYKNTVTEKTAWEKVNFIDPQTGETDLRDFPFWVKEVKTYKAAGPEEGRIVKENRDVYIFTDGYFKLVISQYRLGVEIPLESKVEITKNIGEDIGFSIKFDSPWIDNHIPKQEPPKPNEIGPAASPY